MMDGAPLFGSAQEVELISLQRLADLATAEGSGGPLLDLPPIQRSLVWRNAQILNFWDSLLRGFPPGVMMVHRAAKGTLGRSNGGETRPRAKEGLQLFDGQQRLSALLMGMGRTPPGGVLADRRIWIELGVPLDRAGENRGFRFILRMSSTGQPFGYQIAEPNQKFSIAKRRAFAETSPDGEALEETFARLGAGASLIEACHVVPLARLIEAVATGEEAKLDALRPDRRDGPEACADLASMVEGTLKQAAAAVKHALNLKVPLLLLPEDLVSDPDAYLRFFERVGQGGTRLTDNELVYSVIKQRYPQIHDRIAEIIRDDGAGRWMDEVGLALSALRVATALAADPQIEDWKLARPRPKDVQHLDFEAHPKEPVVTRFKELLPETEAQSTASLLPVLRGLRHALVFHPTHNPLGLLPLTLRWLDEDLIDCLILLAVRRAQGEGPTRTEWSLEDKRLLVAMVLYWMLFVHNSAVAARRVLKAAIQRDWRFDVAHLRWLVRQLDREPKLTRRFPRPAELKAIRAAVGTLDGRLRDWNSRFMVPDADEAISRTGETLRSLTTDGRLLRFALLWIQRRELHAACGTYDPTSIRDEDFPLDLDHLVPRSRWAFHWTEARAAALPQDVRQAFRDHRGLIGNSLGNFRYLSFEENRRRGDGVLGPQTNEGHHVAADRRAAWDGLIGTGATPWDAERAARFQRLIEGRALDLVEVITRAVEWIISPEEASA